MVCSNQKFNQMLGHDGNPHTLRLQPTRDPRQELKHCQALIKTKQGPHTVCSHDFCDVGDHLWAHSQLQGPHLYCTASSQSLPCQHRGSPLSSIAPPADILVRTCKIQQALSCCCDGAGHNFQKQCEGSSKTVLATSATRQRPVIQGGQGRLCAPMS